MNTATSQSVKTVIADDHPMFSQGLSTAIQEIAPNYFEIAQIVDSGDKVLSMLRRHRPKLLLMDMNMPNKDGLDVLNEIKGQFRDLKIIILTMYNDPKLAKEVLRAGANGYVLKTSDTATIFKAIEDVLDDATYVSDELEMGADFPRESKPPNRFEDKFINKHNLTKREVEILKLIAKAKSNKEIGSELFISDQTVSVHRKNLMRKLCVNNAASLLKIAYETNIV